MMYSLQPRRRQFLAWLLALAVGALALWLEHRRQFSSGFDLFPGPRGDTRLIAYLCEHGYQALRGKAEWLSPAMFFPAQGTLGYTDALLLFIPPTLSSVWRGSTFSRRWLSRWWYSIS